MTDQRSYNAEVAVLGALIMHSPMLEDVIGKITPDDFSDYQHMAIFQAMLELRKEGSQFDMLILSSRKGKQIAGGENEAFTVLATICNSFASVSNLQAYVEIVKKESNRRKTAKILSEVFTKIKNGDEDYLEYLTKRLTEVENNTFHELKTYNQILDETIERLERDSKHPGEVTGLTTGFYDLDLMTNGLQKKNLIILAARPSQGKTMMMLNIIDHVAFKQNLPVAVFSLEQSAHDLFKRTLSRVSKIDGDRIFKAKLKPGDWERINNTIQTVRDAKIFINDEGSTSVYDIRNYCRLIKSAHGLGAIFVDYIGMVQGGSAENETLRLGFISRELKVISKDFDVPVFVLCQLNRSIEKEKREPRLSDIRQSGNIEQDADVIMFLETNEEAKEATVYVKKNRNGRTGEVRLTVKMELFEFRNHAR